MSCRCVPKHFQCPVVSPFNREAKRQMSSIKKIVVNKTGKWVSVGDPAFTGVRLEDDNQHSSARVKVLDHSDLTMSTPFLLFLMKAELIWQDVASAAHVCLQFPLTILYSSLLMRFRSFLLTLLGSFFLLGLLAPSSVVAGTPRSQRVECGAYVPVWGVRKRGSRRYRTGYESLRSILKFYRKVLRAKGISYSSKPLLMNDKVTSYHIRSKSSSTRWAGVNVALYRRSAKIEAFIICR